MNTSSRIPGVAWMVALALGLALAGCSGGEDVTTRSLNNARRVWEQARIRDYNLEWTSTGPRTGHYLVYVRGGEVRAVRMIEHDGHKLRELDVKPRTAQNKSGADLSYYGVDGLFKILEEELAQLLEDAPFGRPKGTQAVIKFTPDPKLGYPRSYRRDVVGSTRGLAIDVIRLDPTPPPAIPPPAG